MKTPKKLDYVHAGEYCLRKFHISTQIESFHDGVIEKDYYHPGKIESKHCGEGIQRHPGQYIGQKSDHNGPKAHKHGAPITSTNQTGETVIKCQLCGKNFDTQGCMEVYTCCSGGANSKSCTEYCRWDCCGKIDYDAPPCRTTYSCCSSVKGCESRYNCCDAESNAQGCKSDRIYSCCQSPLESTSSTSSNQFSQGCKHRYNCCKRISSDDGCQDETIWSCCLNKELKKYGLFKKISVLFKNRKRR